MKSVCSERGVTCVLSVSVCACVCACVCLCVCACVALGVALFLLVGLCVCVCVCVSECARNRLPSGFRHLIAYIRARGCVRVQVSAGACVYNFDKKKRQIYVYVENQ